MSDHLLRELKSLYPKSWDEFMLVAEGVLKSSAITSALVVEDLPFDLSFGILLKFFKENELEFDYNNLESSQYDAEIHSIFSNFENTISHYS